MRRILFLLFCLLPIFGHAGYPAVVPGTAFSFPEDFGAHPDYRTEWWYITGWVADAQGVERGFQVTFFRVRTLIGEGDAGRFAPRQLVLAHAAVADPAEGRLLHAERAARELPPLAGAGAGRTRVWIDDWSLEQRADTYRAQIVAEDFSLDLEFVPDRPPVPNGREGFSQKAPDSINASYYYSRPQLAAFGSLSIRGEREAVAGAAWLDHEWSSEILPDGAQGWDWIGINLDDGSSLMAFRMRDTAGGAMWSAATLADAAGKPSTHTPAEVHFEPRRAWRSPRTGAEYPVEWTVTVGEQTFEVRPLMDDQELDSRNSTGAVYWEGAVRLFEAGAEVGRGYLEMTGYHQRLNM